MRRQLSSLTQCHRSFLYFQKDPFDTKTPDVDNRSGRNTLTKVWWTRNPVLVLGNPRSALFKNSYLKEGFPSIYLHVCYLRGAIVLSFEQTNLQTNSQRIFRRTIEIIIELKSTIIVLDEDDIGCFTWQQRCKVQRMGC